MRSGKPARIEPNLRKAPTGEPVDTFPWNPKGAYNVRIGCSMLSATFPCSPFETFLAELQEPGQPIISPLRFAQKLNLEQQRLAELAHVHRNTVNRMPGSPRLQDFLREAVRVLAAAFSLAESQDRALYWFRSHPIPDFDYKTPEILVSEGKADAVIRYIESLSAGASG